MAKICYHSSGIVLHIDSDVSYLSVRGTRRRVGGHFFLSELSKDLRKPPSTIPPQNGPLHAVSFTLRHIMVSAVEAEYAGIFFNDQDAIIFGTALEELGHN